MDALQLFFSVLTFIISIFVAIIVGLMNRNYNLQRGEIQEIKTNQGKLFDKVHCIDRKVVRYATIVSVCHGDKLAPYIQKQSPKQLVINDEDDLFRILKDYINDVEEK